VVKFSLTVTVAGAGVVSPRVAFFSSRGPSPAFPGILKVYINILFKTYYPKAFYSLALASAPENLYMEPIWGVALVPAATWNVIITQPKYFASTCSEVVNLTGLL
jgi:hypothetical protein